MYQVMSVASKRTRSWGYLLVFLLRHLLAFIAGHTPTILAFSLTTRPNSKLL